MEYLDIQILGGYVELKLKSISTSSIPKAISKVELYRYLNEPEEAESICRDILAVEPDNQTALRLLGLTITDQFTGNHSDRWKEAEGIFLSLTDRYEKLYFVGLLHERRAKTQLGAGHSLQAVMALFEQAMNCFEEAEKICPEDNDDAILRWNRCVRLLQSLYGLEWQQEEEGFEVSDSPPI
jgi:tetratricopeptide (TPR) repeat protein